MSAVDWWPSPVDHTQHPALYTAPWQLGVTQRVATVRNTTHHAVCFCQPIHVLFSEWNKPPSAIEGIALWYYCRPALSSSSCLFGLIDILSYSLLWLSRTSSLLLSMFLLALTLSNLHDTHSFYCTYTPHHWHSFIDTPDSLQVAPMKHLYVLYCIVSGL